ncbi:hypothetical protein GBA52_025491 [Prunus armeniaca]|nr:hypothetical protein GBA52_025491 [Prunus armeniaca]
MDSHVPLRSEYWLLEADTLPIWEPQYKRLNFVVKIYLVNRKILNQLTSAFNSSTSQQSKMKPLSSGHAFFGTNVEQKWTTEVA